MRSIFISRRDFNLLPGEKRWKRNLRVFLKLTSVGFLTGILFVAGVFIYFMKDLPSPGKVNMRFIAESTKIFDRTGNHLLYDIHGEEKRTVIPFEEIPEVARYATIALEDQDFYSHHGIKFTSIARAIFKDIFKRKAVQGGSTITQQFVKNSILTREKTFTRKIKEVILSIEMEQKFSKDEILGMYLNEIPYGSNAYGIEAGAQTFFGKPARELTLDEAALLASLPQAPSRYSPYGSRPEELKARQEYALKQMAKLGYITEEDAQKYSEVDVLSKITVKRENIDAPHFVMYVKEYLESKYGEQTVEQGGLKVYTTLDWDKQQIAEKAVREGAEKNMKSWNANNASLVAIDPKTGQILSMVGSKDYFEKSQPEGCVTGKTCKFEGQVNVAIRDRQPGSSFKPYVYLTAFAKGYTPETTLYDVETNFVMPSGQKDYVPQNYDGKFRGPLQMKQALPMSLNIPAVKTLYLVGVNNAVAMAKNLGITGLNQPKRYGLSLVLGGGEVKLLDHVNAFGTLATGGIKHTKTAILKIEDGKGNALEEYKTGGGERVVDEKYVAMLDHAMSTNEYRASVFGENSPLRSDNRPIAAKTGTTNEFRDGWIIGYTPSIAVGVWAGNNDNSPMRVGADGVNVAAPIWRSFLDQVLVNSAVEKFPKYELEEVGKDVLDGKLTIKDDVKVCEIPDKNNEYCLANSNCPDKEVKKKDFADVHTILYYVDRNDPRGDAPKKPEEDPQFKNWEKAIQKWYEKEKDSNYVSGKPPENECKKEDFSKFLPTVSLNASYDSVGFVLKLSASSSVPYGVSKIEFFIDSDNIASGTSGSTNYTVPDAFKGSSHKIRVELTDKNGNKVIDSKDISM